MTLGPDYWERYHQQRRALMAVKLAVASGKLVRGDCARRDDALCHGRIEGHHEDYDAPLDVVWLCVKHHNQLHTERRRAALGTDAGEYRGSA